MTVEFLTQQANSLRNRIGNDISTKKHHPSYGVTKKGLLSTYNQLVGILWSIDTMSGNYSVSVELGANRAASGLDINLSALMAAINNA